MTGWRKPGEPAENAEQAPPQLPAISRVAELFEALFNLERDLTAELLAELARCDAGGLIKLFGNPLARRAAPAPAEPEPVVEQVATMAKAQQPDPHKGWLWDSTGKRLSPQLPSSFSWTKNSERPVSRRSHWSD